MGKIKTRPKSLEGQWFYLKVEIFPFRVFCFVGSRRAMTDSALQAMRDKFKQPDYKYLNSFFAKGVITGWENEDESCDESFGRGSVGFIRMTHMDVCNIDNILALNHECLHTADRMMIFAGISEGTPRECLSYTQEYIAGKILKMMNGVSRGKRGEIDE